MTYGTAMPPERLGPFYDDLQTPPRSPLLDQMRPAPEAPAPTLAAACDRATVAAMHAEALGDRLYDIALAVGANVNGHTLRTDAKEAPVPPPLLPRLHDQLSRLERAQDRVRALMELLAGQLG